MTVHVDASRGIPVPVCAFKMPSFVLVFMFLLMFTFLSVFMHIDVSVYHSVSVSLSFRFPFS